MGASLGSVPELDGDLLKSRPTLGFFQIKSITGVNGLLYFLMKLYVPALWGLVSAASFLAREKSKSEVFDK